MAQGWLRLHRSMANHWLWTEDRVFSKAEAWFDLLMMVNHAGWESDDEWQIDGGKGRQPDHLHPKSFLSRWKWSRKKVTNYFNLLQNDGMIAFASTSKYTLVTVLNWAFYQGESEIRNIKSTIRRTSREHHWNNRSTSQAHKQ